MKIAQYKVIKKLSADSLELEVDRYIDAGWQPYGSLVVTKCEDCQNNFLQTMVRYAPNKGRIEAERTLENLINKLSEMSRLHTTSLGQFSRIAQEMVSAYEKL